MTPPPIDLLDFEEHLVQRGCCPSTIEQYSTGLRALFRAGNSPGCGPTESPAAAEARGQYMLTRRASAPRYRAAWAHWTRFMLGFNEVIPPLDAPILGTPPYDISLSIGAVADAVGILRARQLCWSHVDHEAGMVAGADMVELRQSFDYGRDRLKVVLGTLHDFNRPPHGGCLVLPADGPDSPQIVPYSVAALRTFRLQVRELLQPQPPAPEPRPKGLGGIQPLATPAKASSPDHPPTSSVKTTARFPRATQLPSGAAPPLHQLWTAPSSPPTRPPGPGESPSIILPPAHLIRPKAPAPVEEDEDDLYDVPRSPPQPSARPSVPGGSRADGTMTRAERRVLNRSMNADNTTPVTDPREIKAIMGHLWTRQAAHDLLISDEVFDELAREDLPGP